MGWDRRVLPRDRGSDETFPWVGAVAAIVIIGVFLLRVWLAFGVFGEETSQVPLPTGG